MFKNKDLLLALIKGTAKGLIGSGLLLGAAAVLITYVSVEETVVGGISIIALAILCYVSAHSSSQIYRKNGLLQGIICSAFVMIPMAVFSTIFNGYLSDYCIVKLIVAAVSGLIGGVSGINTKKTRIK